MKTQVFNQQQVNLDVVDSNTMLIEISKAKELTIHVHENIQTLLVLTIQSKDIDINLHIDNNASLRLLYHFDDVCNIKERAYLKSNANLMLAYYHLHTSNATHDLKYYLQGHHANVEVITSSVTSGLHHYDIECIHEVGNTSSKMENYAIVNEHADYVMQANGIIVKGAKGSKSHQSTKVLTSSDKQNSKVTPLLFIDENDVEASHAASVGQINEDHLYYLQTRGLSKEEALGLLTLSYVLPILKVVEDNEELKNKLAQEIEMKVGLSCSI